MLSPQIKELIYQRYGHPLVIHADYVRLSKHIYSVSRDPYMGVTRDTATISPEVLEQMFSVTDKPVYPGGEALNTIAQYLGYYYWDHLPGYDTVAPEINRQYHEETKHWRKQFIRNRLLFGYIPVLLFILFVCGVVVIWNKTH